MNILKKELNLLFSINIKLRHNFSQFSSSGEYAKSISFSHLANEEIVKKISKKNNEMVNFNALYSMAKASYFTFP